MTKSQKDTINVQGTEISLYSQRTDQYISLTDMAKHKNSEIPAVVISHWMTTIFAVNFMGVWERMNNPNFNLTGFREIKMIMTETGFALSPKQWIEKTNAIGITSKSGRYGGGTFAHRNIAFEFASWLSPEFKYYLISEFDRLKQDEQQRLSSEWNLQRTLSKINYNLNHDFYKIKKIYMIIILLIKKILIKSWFKTNMESINALLIRQGLSQSERLIQLNNTAITQMKSLLDNHNLIKRLE